MPVDVSVVDEAVQQLTHALRASDEDDANLEARIRTVLLQFADNIISTAPPPDSIHGDTEALLQSLQSLNGAYDALRVETQAIIEERDKAQTESTRIRNVLQFCQTRADAQRRGLLQEVIGLRQQIVQEHPACSFSEADLAPPSLSPSSDACTKPEPEPEPSPPPRRRIQGPRQRCNSVKTEKPAPGVVPPDTVRILQKELELSRQRVEVLRLEAERLRAELQKGNDEKTPSTPLSPPLSPPVQKERLTKKQSLAGSMRKHAAPKPDGARSAASTHTPHAVPPPAASPPATEKQAAPPPTLHPSHNPRLSYEENIRLMRNTLYMASLFRERQGAFVAAPGGEAGGSGGGDAHLEPLGFCPPPIDLNSCDAFYSTLAVSLVDLIGKAQPSPTPNASSDKGRRGQRKSHTGSEKNEKQGQHKRSARSSSTVRRQEGGVTPEPPPDQLYGAGARPMDPPLSVELYIPDAGLPSRPGTPSLLAPTDSAYTAEARSQSNEVLPTVHVPSAPLLPERVEGSDVVIAIPMSKGEVSPAGEEERGDVEAGGARVRKKLNLLSASMHFQAEFRKAKEKRAKSAEVFSQMLAAVRNKVEGGEVEQEGEADPNKTVKRAVEKMKKNVRAGNDDD